MSGCCEVGYCEFYTARQAALRNVPLMNNDDGLLLTAC
jgi:hypothetical protein